MPKTTTNQVSANLVINEVNFISIVASEIGATNANFVNTNSSIVNTSILNADDINISVLSIQNANIETLNSSTINASVLNADNITDELNEINSSIDDIQNDIIEINSSIDDIQNDIIEINSSINDIQNDIIEINSSIDDIQNEIDDFSVSFNSSLINSSTINSSVGNIDNIDASLNDLQQQINNIDFNNISNLNVSNLNASTISVIDINGTNFNGLVAQVQSNTSDIEANEIAISDINTSLSTLNGQVQLNAAAILQNNLDIDDLETNVSNINTSLNTFVNTGFQTSGFVYGQNACFSNIIQGDDIKATSILRTEDIRVEGDYQIVTGNGSLKTLVTTDNIDVYLTADEVEAIRLIGFSSNTSFCNSSTVNCSTINASLAVFDETIHQQHDAVDLNVSDLHASFCLIDTNCSIGGQLNVDRISTFSENTISFDGKFLTQIEKLRLLNREVSELSGEGQIIYDRILNFGGGTGSALIYQNSTQTTEIYDRQNFLIDSQVINNILDPISDLNTSVSNLNTSVSNLNTSVSNLNTSVSDLNDTVTNFNTSFTTTLLNSGTINSSVHNSSTITSVFVNSSNGNISQLTSVQHNCETINCSTLNVDDLVLENIDLQNINVSEKVTSKFIHTDLIASGDIDNFNRCYLGDLSKLSELSGLDWNASLLETLNFGAILGQTFGKASLVSTGNASNEGLLFYNVPNVNASSPHLNASLLRDGDMYIRTSLDVPTLNCSTANIDNINVSDKSASNINCSTLNASVGDISNLTSNIHNCSTINCSTANIDTVNVNNKNASNINCSTLNASTGNISVLNCPDINATDIDASSIFSASTIEANGTIGAPSMRCGTFDLTGNGNCSGQFKILGNTKCGSTIIYDQNPISADLYGLWLKQLSIRLDSLTANRVLGLNANNIIETTNMTLDQLSNLVADIPLNYVQTFRIGNIYGGGSVPLTTNNNDLWGNATPSTDSLISYSASFSWSTNTFRSSTEYITVSESGVVEFNVNSSAALGVWEVYYSLGVRNNINSRVNFRAFLSSDTLTLPMMSRSQQYARNSEGKCVSLNNKNIVNFTDISQKIFIDTKAEVGTGDDFTNTVANYSIQDLNLSFKYLGKN